MKISYLALYGYMLMVVLALTLGAGDLCCPSGYPERLLPLSCYGQAVEACMRVLTDRMHEYDQETAADLCVGRLVRLSHAVVQMEYAHTTKKLYPSEDITYMLALVSIVAKERKDEFGANTVASSIMNSVKSRLALLLRYR